MEVLRVQQQALGREDLGEMSDCSTNAWKGYDTLMLHIDFAGEDQPWTYPLALNGRKVERVMIGGVEYVKKEPWQMYREPLPDDITHSGAILDGKRMNGAL